GIRGQLPGFAGESGKWCPAPARKLAARRREAGSGRCGRAFRAELTGRTPGPDSRQDRMDREKIPETQPHYWIQGLSPFVQRLGTVPSAGAAEVSAGAFEDATVVPAPGRPEFFGG